MPGGRVSGIVRNGRGKRRGRCRGHIRDCAVSGGSSFLRCGGGSIIRINIVSVSGAEQNAFEIRRKLFFWNLTCRRLCSATVVSGSSERALFLGWRLTNSASLQSLRIWSCSSSFSSSPEREAVAGRRTGKVFSAVSSVLRNVGFFLPFRQRGAQS